MKSLFKFLGFIALVAVIGFVITACKDDPPETPPPITTLTYKGRDDNNNEWVLKITGSSYELTKGVLNKSTGTVINKLGTTYSLKPSVTATGFNATVTSGGLVELQGTIVWYAGGQSEALPGSMTPTGGTGGGNTGGGDNPVIPGGEEPALPGEPAIIG